MLQVQENPSIESAFMSSSAEVIASVQQEDLSELKSSLQAEDESDVEMAVRFYEAELTAWIAREADQRLARSIARAVLADAKAVHQVITEEERASQDRLLACQIAGVAPSPPNIALQVVAGATELASFIRYASASGPTELSPGDGPVPSACHAVEIGESSSSANRTKENSERTTKMICSACREEKHSFDILHALCGHEYCRDCIASFFNLSTFHESVFPPRCCQQEISVDLATEMLSPELRTRFLKTAEKFHTPNRIFCFSSSCSELIPRSQIAGDIGTCHVCSERTCIMCKSAAHNGDCPQDPTLQQVIKTGDSLNWQRCFKCGGMIERVYGCNHMRQVSFQRHF